MSWLSEFFGGGGGGSAPTLQVVSPSSWSAADWDSWRQYPIFYEPVKHLDPKYIAEQQAAASASQAADLQAQIAAAQASAPAPAPAGPTAAEELRALLPAGFEQTALPSSFLDPFVESMLTSGRGVASDAITNMIRRGQLSSSGGATATTALSAQDPAVRSRLRDIGNVLLAQEQANLRGIANTGYAAAGGAGGEAFDPNPYQGQVQSSIANFQSAFPSSYTTAVGDVGGLYNVGTASGAGGAVTGPRNISFDPYAVAGGQLETGLEERPAPGSQKKRTTAVF